MQPYGVALFDPNFGADGNANFVVNTGTTPFAPVPLAGAACGVTAQARPDGSIALYGPKIVFDAGTTPFVRYGRTSGVYQMQIRLRRLEEIPGSVIQYSSIHYATNGIDIKGLPNQLAASWPTRPAPRPTTRWRPPPLPCRTPRTSATC